jgi:hypothetical protein
MKKWMKQQLKYKKNLEKNKQEKKLNKSKRKLTKVTIENQKRIKKLVKSS